MMSKKTAGFPPQESEPAHCKSATRSDASLAGQEMLKLQKAGYAPLPVVPGSKIPGLTRYMGDWSHYCGGNPASIDMVEKWAASAAGVSVALGGGLVAIDIDTDCPEVLAAVSRVVPSAPSSKRGQKGQTDFYYDPTGAIKTKRYTPVDSNMPLVELLAKGAHSVLPPTVHPDTCRPYHWLGRPLYEIPLNALPVIKHEMIAALGEALTPFLGQKTTRIVSTSGKMVAHQPQRSPGNASDFVVWSGDPKRLELWVRSQLKTKSAELAVATGGRNQLLFDIACQFGRYVHGGVISKVELERVCRDAYAACGALAEHHEYKLTDTLERALARTASDDLTVPDAIALRLNGVQRAERGGFAKIPNVIIVDKRLKAPALVTLAYRMTRPVDWVLRKGDLARIVRRDGRCGLGKDRAQAAISTLNRLGFIERTQRIINGRRAPARELLKVAQPAHDFVVVPANLFDGSLSVNAVAVVIFLRSGRAFTREIVERFGWGRTAAYKAIHEGIDTGHVKPLASRQENGQFAGIKYEAAVPLTGR